jgi:signal transduction histidine kinase
MAGGDDERQEDLRQAATEEAHAAERRLTFLYSATDALLRAGAEPSGILGRLAEISVPDLADVAMAWLSTNDGRATCVAASHFDPARAQALGEMVGQTTPVLHPVLGLGRVLVTGESELLPYVGRTMLGAGGPMVEHHRQLLETLSLRSYILISLRSGERVLGALLFGTSTSERFYGPEDQTFAEDLAQRAALVIENAQAREKAETAARMRKNLLAMVSHDLRNPLNAIVINASLIQRGVEDPRQLRWLSGIQQNAQRMNTLIQDLLDMAAIEAGSVRLDLGTCGLRQLLDEAEQAFSTLAQSKGIVLTVEADPGCRDLAVACDPDRVQQVFSNLVGNALKFTPPGGTIRVTGRGSPEGAQLTVTDTGPGIAPDELRRIFDPYWQSGGRQGGVGLGLSIARGLVQAHGGRLWAESEPGRGAAFHFTLPAAARTQG